MTLKLKDICVIDWGNTSLTKKAYEVDGEYLAVSATGADGKISHYEHEADVCVLSAIGAQCGKMFFPQQRFTAIKNTITLTPNRELVDSKYLYYLFTYIELPKRGAAQPFISKGDIEKFELPHLPPLAEQQRIVAKLDVAFAEIDRVVESYEDSISNTKDFLSQVRASRISEILNSSQKAKLGSLASLKNGLNYNKSEKGYAVKILGVGDFGNRFRTGTEGLQVIETSSPVSTDYHLKHGDIVFVRSNGNKQLIGRSIVIENPDETATFSGFCIRCRIETEDISPVFLCHYLKSSVVRDKLTSGGVGVNISSLNQKMLADIDVPLLSEHEQASLVRWVEELEKGFEDYVETLVKKVQLVNKLKSAILKQELQPSEAA